MEAAHSSAAMALGHIEADEAASDVAVQAETSMLRGDPRYNSWVRALAHGILQGGVFLGWSPCWRIPSRTEGGVFETLNALLLACESRGYHASNMKLRVANAAMWNAPAGRELHRPAGECERCERRSSGAQSFKLSA